MKKKLITSTAIIGTITASLITLSASALSTATMSLSGSINNNGNFVTTVYENTGSDTVTGANVVLDFSTTVTGVSYDYSVGPFSHTTPDGAHGAYGPITGTQAVATVRFTLPNPGTVTASIDPSSSFLKHVDNTTSPPTVENFALATGSASFTHTAPVVKSGGGSTSGGHTSTTSNNTTNAGSSTPASSNSTSSIATSSSKPTANSTKSTPATKNTTMKSYNSTAVKTTQASAPAFKLTSDETDSTGLVLLVVVAGAIGYFAGARKLPKLPKVALKVPQLKLPARK